MSDSTIPDNHHPHLSLSEHARKNRALWEASSDSYEQRHAADLSEERALSRGFWRIPEAKLHILGEAVGVEQEEGGRHDKDYHCWPYRSERLF